MQEQDQTKEAIAEQQEQEVENNTAETTDTTDKNPSTTDTSENNEIEKLKAELADSKDKYIRLYSEFENFRRRTAKEKTEFVYTATENLIKDLLSIIDDFERAEKYFDEEAKKNISVKEGFELIQHKLKRTLELKGLKVIDCKVGDDFDTEKHEAVTQFAAPSEELKGKVVDVLEKGYLLGEKVIRFTKVVVGM
jgi:molecular chaperone GrpE